MACLHHLNPKTVPWHQGARLRGVIHHARCPRVKKGAAKKSRGREKLHLRSPRHLVKTACRLQWRSADLAKTKILLTNGPRRPPPGNGGAVRKAEATSGFRGPRVTPVVVGSSEVEEIAGGELRGGGKLR